MISIKDFEFLSLRDPESYKGDYGHALLIAGSYGKMGAAVLAARACLRAGCGLLTVHTPRAGVSILQTAVPEAMLSIDDDMQNFTSMPKHLELYNAIAVGPGIGTSPKTQNALKRLLSENAHSTAVPPNPKKQMVLDADALNILSRHQESLPLASGAVITPHSMEYSRLFAASDPQSMADAHNLVIVKKSHNTCIYAPNVPFVVNETGNAGMATAGSGDVLTGITLGLMAQAASYPRRHKECSYDVQQVTALAVQLHGLSGDIAAHRLSQASVVASDIINCIPEAIQNMIADVKGQN